MKHDMLSKLSQRLLHTREQCRRLRSRLENTCVAMTTPSAMAGRSANKTKSTIAATYVQPSSVIHTVKKPPHVCATTLHSIKRGSDEVAEVNSETSSMSRQPNVHPTTWNRS